MGGSVGGVGRFRPSEPLSQRIQLCGLVGPRRQRQEQAVLGERKQPRQRSPILLDFALLQITCRGHHADDCADCVEAHPAHENPQAAEEPPLRLRQEVVAPADRSLEAALPLGQVRCLGGQQP